MGIAGHAFIILEGDEQMIGEAWRLRLSPLGGMLLPASDVRSQEDPAMGGKGGGGGGGKGGGLVNAPSTTGNKSGGGRGNNSPSK